ncbi:MAG: gliding motility-associated C-terminal domain-containing protein [Flavobacteriales bacterium]|jgi:gliding motility-associated-like protein|nr:gliding motility-associated C-terminal domain-containing protein [Flavobacteriales bacterium]
MLRNLLISVLLCLLIATTARATHISGGEIYYDCLGGNQYRITLVVYRDCAGIQLDNSYPLDIQSPCGPPTTMTVTTPGGVEISQLCDLELPNSTCNGGSLPGIQQFIYTGTVTLPPCDSWTISWTKNWRNGAIANLVQPGNKNVYIEAKLNNLIAPCDDSPQFTNTAIPYVCAGYPISYSYGAYDPAGDSLTYTFISAMNTGAVNLPYVAGFSGTEPITGITLDPHSGQVNFTLNQTGNWVVVVRVDQYDENGNWIGSVMRDMQFIAYPCTNIPPDPATGIVDNLSGLATQTGPRAIEICESGDFCFDAVITDANANNVITATSNVTQNLPGATFSYTGTNPITVHVCWTGIAGTSGFFPFIITANDGACPIPAQQTYVYSIHVLPGISYFGPDIIDESCAGNGDGSASVSVDVGTEPFHFLWNTGDTTPYIVAGAGDYTVTISDGNGCVNGPIDATIGEANQASTALAGPDLVACQGALPVALHGAVTNAPGGTWSGGLGTITGMDVDATYMPTPAEIASGGVDLYFTTTGESPCGPAQDTVHIVFSSSFNNASIGSTDILCLGNANGTATFTPNSAALTYLWDDPAAQATATASGLSPGPYSVLVTDSYGCDTTMSVSISAPAALAITSLDVVDEQCAGNGDGSITANVTGGTAPYHYSWSNGDTTVMIQAGAGNYTLDVTDANGCAAAQSSATIDALGQPNVADAGADLTGCFASLPVQLNGSVTNATGGTWGGGTGTFAGTGLEQTYMPTSAEIMANGVDLVLTTTGNTTCPPDQDTVHITLPTSFFSAGVASVNATCNATATGSASFTPNDPGFTYLWSDPTAQSTANATGLVAGGYSVLVTDSYGCDTSMSVSIKAPDAIAIADLSVVDEQCAGNGDGSITATVTGGTTPYHYTWSNGDTTAILHAGAGTYTLSVTDANGCVAAQSSATIQALGQPNLANAGADLIGCFSSLPVQINGAVTNATGGTWSGGNGTFSGAGLQQNYMPSPAEIMANGIDLVLTTTGNTTCPADQDTIHITLPTSFFGSAVSSSALACNNDHSGSAQFSPNDPAFIYLWDDASAQTTATASGLAAGTYTVHVTDNYGCDTTASVVITEPSALNAANASGTPPSCLGGVNGSATVQPMGGTPGYSYQWSSNANSQTTPTAYGLPSGAYTVVVTDANGCHAQATTTLAAPTAITLTAQVADTVCVNTPVLLTAQASGGAGGYTITWAGIGTGDTVQFSFPASQVVNVSVVDQAGCPGPMLEFPVTVLDLSQAVLHTYGDTAFCPGGTATVGAWLTGYPGNASISWPQLPATGNGPFSVPANSSRNLTVTATDACANTLQGNVAITVETPPAITLPPIIAEGCAPVTAHFPAGLTNQPVSYLWHFGDGSTSTSISPVHVYPAGDYTVSLTVTTPLGCIADAQNTSMVHSYSLPVAAFTADPWETDADHADVQFTDQSTGSISTWDWTFGDGGISIDPDPAYHYIEPGTWQVVLYVTDEHGCTANVDHTVKINPIYDVTIPNAFTPDPNGGGGGTFNPTDLSNDVFYPFIRFVKDFRMRVFNRWGELVFESHDIKQGWDGYYKGKISPQDVYVYQVWVRFTDNKEVQRTGDLTLFR